MRVKLAKTMCVSCALSIILSMVGCGAKRDIPIIGSSAQYTEVLNELESLQKPILEKASKREALDDSDKADLERSIKLIDGLTAYNDFAYSLYFAKGRALQLLERDTDALKALDEAALRASNIKDETVKRTLAEIHYTSVDSLIRAGNHEGALLQAEKALTLYPKNPDFLAAKAACYVQLNELVKAKEAVDQALRIDAANNRAVELSQLIFVAMQSAKESK